MKKLSSLATLLGCMLIIWGCHSEPRLIISPSGDIVIPVEGESVNCTISSNIDWVISGVPGWLKVTPDAGKNDALITISAQANEATNPRECTLSVRNISGTVFQDILVKQEGVDASISVSTADLYIDSDRGSNATISITSNTTWTLSYPASDWLQLSSTQGDKGSNTITVSTSSDNFSDEERSVVVTATTSDKSASTEFTVIQRAMFAPNLRVDLSDIVIMADGIAGTMSFGKDAKGYFELYVEADLVKTYTDKELFSLVLDRNYRYSISEDYFMQTLDPDTEWVYCIIPYNENAYNGPMTKYRFKTKPQTPSFDARLTSGYSNGWYFTSTRQGRCARYYQFVLFNEDADEMAYYLDILPNAFIVYNWVQLWVNEDPERYYIIDSTRNYGDYDSVCCINWGVSDTGSFSNELTYQYRSKSSVAPEKSIQPSSSIPTKKLFITEE